jgi:transposase-like protein
MFVAGVSTHKVGEVAQTLMEVAPSASTVSRLNQTLTEQFEAWRQRRLQTHYRVVYLDGVHFRVRHGSKTDATIILTALGVDLEGSREVLALRACAEESKDGWSCLLQDLRDRGVAEVDLMVTDGHDGLLAALADLFPATLRQRCLVHKQRNVLNAVPQTRPEGGWHRTSRHLETRKERRCIAKSGGLQRQIPPTLSRSYPQLDPRRRAYINVLHLSAGHASLYSHDQCD